MKKNQYAVILGSIAILSCVQHTVIAGELGHGTPSIMLAQRGARPPAYHPPVEVVRPHKAETPREENVQTESAPKFDSRYPGDDVQLLGGGVMTAAEFKRQVDSLPKNAQDCQRYDTATQRVECLHGLAQQSR